MTPAEHYAKAEKFLAAADEQMTAMKRDVDGRRSAPPGAYTDLLGVITATIAAAQAHALLATVPAPTVTKPQPTSGVRSWQDGGS